MSSSRLFVMGSTGSVGSCVLRVVERLNRLPGERRRQVVGLSAATSAKKLREQVRCWGPKWVAFGRAHELPALRAEFPKTVFFSDLNEAVREASFDLLVNAVVGSAGLLPTMTAMSKGADVALANKETLVVGGELVMSEARKRGVRLLPIDSEHAALFALLEGRPAGWARRLVLTASGGPFFRKPVKNPTVEQVLSHPTWEMGAKISVDSATMMNKGLEVIEAHHLFGFSYERLDVVIHPQSIVHGLVEAVDGSFHAHLGSADMAHPVQQALVFPRFVSFVGASFSLVDLVGSGKAMEFFPVRKGDFPLFELACECGKKGGSYPVVLNAANEVAVDLFLKGRIAFESIFSIVHATINNHQPENVDSVDEVLSLDKQVREGVFHENAR